MTDPQFPNRPSHEDFWLMAEVVQDLDSAADDSAGFNRLVSPLVDPESLTYMASQRGLRASYATPNGGDQVMLAAAWLDGFVAGALFTKIKTERAEA